MEPAFHLRSFIGTFDEHWHDDPMHRNTTLEIEIILEGRGRFEWEDRSVQVETGHVVIIPPGIPHRFDAVTNIRFGVIHLQHMPSSLQDVANQLGAALQRPTISALSRMDRDRFELLFRELLRVQSSTLKDRQRSTAVWAEMLLLFLYEHSQADLAAITITKAADYLREHLHLNVKMSDVAKLTGMTVAGFRRTFEKIYGISPKQYQQRCRMQEAKWLLSATDKDMNEIAERLGFNRLHSFSLWFKSVEGLSPSLWRKRQKMRRDEPH
jgi:AraC-type DNA-binding domain-containing proteins